MNANAILEPAEPPLPARPAYDPNNLHPADAEARQYDDTSEGIDWDEIIATTQDDWVARRFWFSSTDYPTHEAAMAALEKLVLAIAEDVEHEVATESSCDAAGQQVYQALHSLYPPAALPMVSEPAKWRRLIPARPLL